MKHTIDASWYDRFLPQVEEFKKNGDYYNAVWAMSNIQILFGSSPVLQPKDIYYIIKEMVLLRENKEYFQLSFLFSRLVLITPDFFTDYKESDKKEFERLLIEERLAKKWANVLRLMSRFVAFDKSIGEILPEERPFLQEQLYEYKAEKLYWDFVMMQSFAYMVDPTLAIPISDKDWSEIDGVLEMYQQKDIWSYCRMASWIAVIEK
jgi:hypothetical protein